MKIMVVMGSKSDMPVAEKVKDVLDEFQVPYEIEVASAHRNPPKVKEIAEREDVDVFIAIAGLSAALPGVIASHTTKPVIGVPVSGKVNLDSILSIVQMPPGIPVAAVGLDNGKNAALLAIEIMALKYPELNERLQAYREKMR
jgi:5-(carboxyamino)imidazole ribonucleotide mutase